MNDQDSMRCFVGIPVPVDNAESISKSIEAAFVNRPLPGRLILPRNYHITLQFLGQTTKELRAKLIERLKSAKLTSPFNIVSGDLGCFPNEKQAQVFWLGLSSGARGVGTLREEIHWISESLGVPKDPFPFTPHLTVARSKEGVDSRGLCKPPHPKGVVIPVNSIALYQSVSTSNGSEYSILESFDLKK